MSPAVMIGQPPPPRVLIVEDDQVTRQSLARLFRLNGAEVATASSLKAALDELAWQPHWVVLDLHLRRDRGEDLLRAIRDQRCRSRWRSSPARPTARGSLPSGRCSPIAFS